MTPDSPSQFLHACGADSPLSLQIVGPEDDTRLRYEMPSPFVLLGRHPQACIHLKDRRVRSRHLYLQVIEGRLFGVGLTDGGILRGQRSFSTGWIDPKWYLRLGPFHVRTTFLPSPLANPARNHEDPLTERAEGFGNDRPLRIDVMLGNVRQARWVMNRRLVLVGRDPVARIRFHDPSVSRFHCSIVGTRQGIWVVDLLSREGISLNGARVTQARLKEGDNLRVGRYDLVIREEDSCPPTPPPTRTATGREVAPTFPTALHASTGDPGDPTVPMSVLVPVLQQIGRFQQEMMDQFQASMQMMFQQFAQMNASQMEVIQEELGHLRRVTEELSRTRGELHELAKPPAKAEPAKKPDPVLPPPRPPVPPARQPTTIPKAARSANLDTDFHAWLTDRIETLEKEREGVLQRVFRAVTGG